MIKEKINEIISKYYNETDDCYNSCRYESYENEFYMTEELENFLKSEKVNFKLKTVSGYSNCAYDSEFLAIAWVENDNLNMCTILLEQY